MTLYKWGKFERKENHKEVTTGYLRSAGGGEYKIVDRVYKSWSYEKGLYDEISRGDMDEKRTYYGNSINDYGMIYKYRYNDSSLMRGWHYDRYLVERVQKTVFSHYSKGSRINTVTSTNRNAYPNDGESGDYWYVYEGIENQAPIISGADAFIGNKSSNFRLDYIVTDNDLDDIVKVEIQEDRREPRVISSINLGVRNYLDINVESYELGDHTITIKATDSQGETTIRTYRWTKINNAPMISGSDKDLGEKNTAFSITYQVSDADNDIVNVVEKINGKVIRTLNNASKNTDLYLNVTQEQILEFEIGTTNTIEIESTDNKGGVSYRRYTFKKTNLPPIISGNDRDLGVVDKLLSYSYSVTDTEDDDIYVDVVIDETYLQKDIKVDSGKTYKVEIKDLDFLKLKPGKHTLKIMATDKKSDKVVRLINFTRDPKRLVVMSAKPIETDAAAKKFYFNPVWKIATGAEGKIEICNNGFDTNPTWEDATSTVKVGKTFNFTNQIKKASKWGIAVKMTINKNNATAISYIATAGGAFE